MCDQDSLIPLSVLALDLQPPAEGWPSFLGRRAIAFRPDGIGRDCVTAKDAQILLAEKRQNELRAAKHRQLQEQQAVEADERRRAQIWKGLSADLLPVGVSASTAMLSAARDSQPRWRTPLEEALANETLTYHSYGDQEAS